jgi:hypothetical protein
VDFFQKNISNSWEWVDSLQIGRLFFAKFKHVGEKHFIRKSLKLFLVLYMLSKVNWFQMILILCPQLSF